LWFTLVVFALSLSFPYSHTLSLSFPLSVFRLLSVLFKSSSISSYTLTPPIARSFAYPHAFSLSLFSLFSLSLSISEVFLFFSSLAQSPPLLPSPLIIYFLFPPLTPTNFPFFRGLALGYFPDTPPFQRHCHTDIAVMHALTLYLCIYLCLSLCLFHSPSLTQHLCS
jgi:hypothetical protein